jgi:biotin transport system substrate-specific component
LKIFFQRRYPQTIQLTANPEIPHSQGLSVNVAAPTQLLWVLIGIILTIGGTLLEAFIASPPWSWNQSGIHAHSLGVTWQVGAVLLVGCLGGKNAAAIAQIAYVLLGLTWFDVFTQGGGVDYVLRPSFGYLIGFIPGAWLCGWLAFRYPVRLEFLAFSCLFGLLAIHLSGIGYLIAGHLLHWAEIGTTPFWQTLVTYSIYPLPGQLAIVCAVTVLAFTLRHLMFY